MKLKSASFSVPVPFGGSIKSANASIPSDVSRVGSEPFEIELIQIEGLPVVSLTKSLSGKRTTVHVPMSNVICFTVEPTPAKK